MKHFYFFLWEGELEFHKFAMVFFKLENWLEKLYNFSKPLVDDSTFFLNCL